MKNANKKEMAGYRIGKLSILEIMIVLAVMGLLATWVLKSFFAS